MEAIILSAGKGSRMGALTNDRPKFLLEVGRQHIYENQLSNLQHYCNKITIVLGHGFEDISDPRDRFGEIISQIDAELKFVVLDNWSEYENAYSAERGLKERQTKNEDVLFVCGDILFESSLLDRASRRFGKEIKPKGYNGVGVIKGLQNKMTGVRWNEEGTINNYGDIKGHQEVGLFFLNSEQIRDAVNILEQNRDYWFPVVFEYLDSKPIFVNGDKRTEINTKSDMISAKEQWVDKD